MIPDPFTIERIGADALVEGYYLLARHRAGRVDIPVRVWFGAPLDPETGEPLERSWRWQVQVGFNVLDEEPVRIGGITISSLSDIWPHCARWPVDETEWRYRIARAEWADEHDPNDAFAEIGGRVDPMKVTLP